MAAAILPADFKRALLQAGFHVSGEYPRTGTVLFTDGQRHYEFTTFRREKYVGGEHTPVSTEFTESLYEDSLRRDFKCNAVYYDIVEQKIIDPLGGVKDIQAKTLDTVSTEGGTRSLLQIRLHTGRFHQIRAQLSSRGASIVGDGKYGSRDKGARMPALCAVALSFTVDREKVELERLPDLNGYPWSLFEKEKYSIKVDL